MKREEAFGVFVRKELEAASAGFLEDTMSFLTKENKQETARRFAQSASDVIRQAPSLSFLQLVLLRSRALKGRPFYRFEAYGADLYRSEPIAAAPAPLDHIYQAYILFMERVDAGSKRYLGAVGEEELARIKLAQLSVCQKIVAHLYYESIVYLIRSEGYQRLDAKKKVQFHLGEYRGDHRVIMTKDETMEKMGELLYGILSDQGA